MADCIFCKILKEGLRNKLVYQDDNFIVFKDIKPKAKVHLLLIPKKHIESVNQLTETDRDLISGMILAAKKVALQEGLDGYKLLFNVGRAGGQLIDHLHLHILSGLKEEILKI